MPSAAAGQVHARRCTPMHRASQVHSYSGIGFNILDSK